MTNRIFTVWIQCLLGILLFPSPGSSLQAQCDGPFDLGCQFEINATLQVDCRAEIIPAMILTNLPDCLADSNFAIIVEDSIPENGAIVDGPGRYQYSVTGQHHPALEGFSCSGFVRLVDATPPVINLFAGPIDRSCSLTSSADINLLPLEVSRCYTIDGTTGAPVPGSLDPRLADALRAGGGIPDVYDTCGGDVEVCVNDAFDQTTPSVCVDTVMLQRSFRARSIDGDPNFAPAFRAQSIRFIRPQLAQLRRVPVSILTNCLEDLEDENPEPGPADYPFFLTNSGPVHIDNANCDYFISYVDGSRIPGCGNTFSFVRTFRIFDLCDELGDTLLTQLVRVGDVAGPVITPPTQDLDFDGSPDVGPLTFSTNTGFCSAILDVGAGVSATDVCSPSVALTAYIYLDGDLTSAPLGPYPILGGTPNTITAPIPWGDHLLRYVAEDACSNASVREVSLRIIDRNPPQVVCASGANISLNTNGFAFFNATSVDGGSSDGCTEVDLRIARVDASDQPLSPPDAVVVFSCDDLGQQRVVMVGQDAAGNENRCWTEVLIEDKTAPSCVAPPQTGVDCQLFSDQFPEDLPTALQDDPAGIGALLDAAFGAGQAVDNCPGATVSQSISGSLDNCGTGQFIREFTVTDGAGFTQSQNCLQVVNILPYTAYSLRFPGDRNYTCGELPASDDFIAAGNGCALFGVNTFRDTLSTVIPGACYALRLTHEVINWCEYDGESLPFTLPRDADGNGSFNEPLFLNVSANTPADMLDDQAYLDQDDIVGNGNELGLLTSNYGGSSRRGFFRYRQFVGIFDNEAPTLSVTPPEEGLAFTTDCLGGILLNLQATDDCGTTDITISIDETIVDRNNDGLITGADFRAEYDVPQAQFSGTPTAGLEVQIRNLPIGTHYARVRAVDDCGNPTQQFVELRVRDGLAPSPVCITNLSVNLVPDIVTGGINTVWASDFVGSPAVTCTETSISYSLYREEEAAVTGFVAQPGAFNIEVDCADLGPNILRLYAFAENTGLFAFCNVVLNVTDNNVLCTARSGQISGLILDRNGDPMRNVEIFNDGPSSLVTFTELDGTFLFDGLEEQVDYTIQPYLNANPINGLSTADLNVIGRRLLGLDESLTPYQLIAADANNNGAITVRDLIAIREVILGFEDDFENNTSWRFLPQEYTFPDPENPWLEEFPEVANLNDLTGAVFTEFVGIKTGDVTGNAEPSFANFAGNGVPPTAPGSSMTLRPSTENGVWELYAPLAGTEEAFSGGAAGAKDRITAVQAALQLPAGTRLLPGLLSPEEYRVDKDNVLRLSRVAAGHQLNHQEPLLRFAVSDNAIPQLITNDPAFRAEAYTADYRTLPLTMIVHTARGGTAPGQLTAAPSPFRTSSVLKATWPAADDLQLTVFDFTGRIVHQRKVEAAPGLNRWSLHRNMLEGQAGVYFVEVRGQYGVATRKIVLQ